VDKTTKPSDSKWKKWADADKQRIETIQNKIDDKEKKMVVVPGARVKKRLYTQRGFYAEVLKENPDLRPSFPPIFKKD